jgi:hypothetical protein
MGISELKYNDKIYTNKRDINEILKSQKFYWLLDSEVSDVIAEIKNNTLIWHDGTFLYGHWNYGIFKNGNFHGIWKNGIWEGGFFDGKWLSGIKLS